MYLRLGFVQLAASLLVMLISTGTLFVDAAESYGEAPKPIEHKPTWTAPRPLPTRGPHVMPTRPAEKPVQKPLPAPTAKAAAKKAEKKIAIPTPDCTTTPVIEYPVATPRPPIHPIRKPITGEPVPTHPIRKPINPEPYPPKVDPKKPEEDCDKEPEPKQRPKQIKKVKSEGERKTKDREVKVKATHRVRFERLNSKLQCRVRSAFNERRRVVCRAANWPREDSEEYRRYRSNRKVEVKAVERKKTEVKKSESKSSETKKIESKGEDPECDEPREPVRYGGDRKVEVKAVERKKTESKSSESKSSETKVVEAKSGSSDGYGSSHSYQRRGLYEGYEGYREEDREPRINIDFVCFEIYYRRGRWWRGESEFAFDSTWAIVEDSERDVEKTEWERKTSTKDGKVVGESSKAVIQKSKTEEAKVLWSERKSEGGKVSKNRSEDKSVVFSHRLRLLCRSVWDNEEWRRRSRSHYERRSYESGEREGRIADVWHFSGDEWDRHNDFDFVCIDITRRRNIRFDRSTFELDCNEVFFRSSGERRKTRGEEKKSSESKSSEKSVEKSGEKSGEKPIEIPKSGSGESPSYGIAQKAESSGNTGGSDKIPIVASSSLETVSVSRALCTMMILIAFGLHQL